MPFFKTDTAALCFALIVGERISIMDGFKKFRLTNIPREIGRLRRRFDIDISSQQFDYKIKGRQPKYYFVYWLDKKKNKKKNIDKIYEYIENNMIRDYNDAQLKIFR